MSNKKNNYSINHLEGTIIITRDFYKKSSKANTPEFRALANLHKAYPDYAIQLRTANISKEKQTHHDLTINFMENYIKKYDKDNLENYTAAKEYYSNFKGYYGKLKSWFIERYPDYRNTIPTVSDDNNESANIDVKKSA